MMVSFRIFSMVQPNKRHDYPKYDRNNIKEKKLSALKKEMDNALAGLALLKEVPENINKISDREALILKLKKEQAHMETGRESYHTSLYDISKTVHPFDLKTNVAKNSEDLKLELSKTLVDLHLLSAEYGINDKNNRLSKYGRQIEDITWLIDYWWLLTDESLAQYEIDETCRTWLIAI
ncbi:MAG: hypothetical protein JEZ12_21515 [Desulfobacterium sp.]|nr:hypothetical protein [Desulfobacterium sp.]